MSCKFACLLLILLLTTMPMLSLSQAQPVPSMRISMGGVEKSTLVAGIIHNVSISLAQTTDHLVLRAYLPSGAPNWNSSNNYSWSYSSGVWADDLYDYYLKGESSRHENTYCFYLAVDSQAVPGNWRFIIIVDGIETSSRQITVEPPVAGISMSAPKFYFNVIPYGTGYISSWNSEEPSRSEYLTTRNTGNVPLSLKITFVGEPPFGTSKSFNASNSTGTYLPTELRTHYIDFQAQSWSPRKFQVKGYVSGEPQLLMTPNTVSTIIAPRTTFDVVVTVARPGYDVYQIDGVSVQYKSFYYSAYRRTLSLDMYLTGNKSVYMGQEMQNISFNHFLVQGQQSKGDVLLELSDNVERHVAVNITCSSAPPWKQPSMIAYAHFNLRLADDSATGRFTSNVVVSSSAEAEAESQLAVNMMVIIALAVIFLVIGIIVFKAYKKTEEERRRELEDRIRKKKERAKKQRRR